MSDLVDPHPDHLHLLSLARAAIDADHGPQWKKDPEAAMAHHGACCDALWDELRRQVDIHSGVIPAIEHPALKQRALAKRLRGDIVRACQDAINHALENLVFEHD